MRKIRSAVLMLSLVSTSFAGTAGSLKELQFLAQTGRWSRVLSLTDAETTPSPDGLYYRGIALAHLNRLDDAEATLTSGLRQYPSDYRFPLELGGLSFARRDFDRTRKLVRRALALNPSDAYATDLLATTCYLSGDPESALEYWNRIDKPKLSAVSLKSRSNLDPLLVNRLIPAVPGETLALQDLLDTRAELSSLHIYSGLRAALEPESDGRSALQLSLLEKRGLLGGTRSAILSAGRGLPFQTVHADLFNIDGAAMNLNGLFRWDHRKQRVLARLERPFILHPQWRWSLGSDLRREDWRLRGNGPDQEGQFPIFGLQRRELGFRLDWISGARWHWSGGPRLTWRRFDFGDQGPAAETEGWNGWSLDYRTTVVRSLLHVPEHRLDLRSMGRMIAGAGLSSGNPKMLRLEGGIDLSVYLRPRTPDWRVHLSYRAGLISGSPPPDELFFIGLDLDDPNSLRGHIGTQDGFKGNAPFGTREQLIRSEVVKRVWGNGLLGIELGPFFDVGKAWAAPGLPPSRGWLADTGIRLAVDTPLGVGIACYWGWDLIGGGSSWYAMPQDPLLPGQGMY